MIKSGMITSDTTSTYNLTRFITLRPNSPAINSWGHYYGKWFTMFGIVKSSIFCMESL